MEYFALDEEIFLYLVHKKVLKFLFNGLIWEKLHLYLLPTTLKLDLHNWWAARYASLKLLYYYSTYVCLRLAFFLQLLSCLLACLALMAFWFCVTVDSDDPVMLVVSTISMSLHVRHATSFWRDALCAKKNSWDTPASTAPSTGPIQYTWRQVKERSAECEQSLTAKADVHTYTELNTRHSPIPASMVSAVQCS